MTKFNPENKDVLTYAEALGPAMKITDPEDAKQYKDDYIKFTQKIMDREGGESKSTAEEVVNQNLGYYAGYYDNATRLRVEKLFQCSHPVFGSIEKNGEPTPKEAFQTGFQRKTLDQIRNKDESSQV